jgi:hypothetical protein
MRVCVYVCVCVCKYVCVYVCVCVCVCVEVTVFVSVCKYVCMRHSHMTHIAGAAALAQGRHPQSRQVSVPPGAGQPGRVRTRNGHIDVRQ